MSRGVTALSFASQDGSGFFLETNLKGGKARSREISGDGIGTIHTREDGGVDQNGSSRSAVQCADSNVFQGRANLTS